MPAILDQFGRPIRTRKSRSRWQELLARYDAAQTTDENMRHWQYVDGLSADAANSPEVRRTLRNRARYETANNCYARGIADTLAGDVIGTGPRLQVLTGDKDIDALVERRFHQRAKEVKLAKKLRTMRKSKCVDGEAFALLVTNNRLTTPVKLDLRLIEADQVTTPTLKPLGPNAVDGIRFDEDGNPIEYHVLKRHPGSDGTALIGDLVKPDPWEAEYVIHVFREDRSGQHRGVPEITSALPLFGQLRRYVLAVLAAAETAAEFAAVIQTNLPAGDDGLEPSDDEDGPIVPKPMDVFELAQRLVTVSVDGDQLKISSVPSSTVCSAAGFSRRSERTAGFWQVGC